MKKNHNKLSECDNDSLYISFCLYHFCLSACIYRSVVFIILDVEDMEEQNNADKDNLDGPDHDGLQISQNWICKKKNDEVEEDGDENINQT